MREERIVLEDEADAAVAHRNVGGVLVAEMDVAAIGIFEAGDHAQDRRLAGAGGPEQRHQLAALDIERDAVHGAERVEGLHDIVEADIHGVFPCGAAGAGDARAGRPARPAPCRSSSTLAMMVTTASTVRMEAAAKAPTVW